MDDIGNQIQTAVQGAVADQAAQAQADQAALAASVHRSQTYRQKEADQAATHRRISNLELANRKITGDNGIQVDRGLISPTGGGSFSGQGQSVWIVSNGTMQQITV